MIGFQLNKKIVTMLSEKIRHSLQQLFTILNLRELAVKQFFRV